MALSVSTPKHLNSIHLLDEVVENKGLYILGLRNILISYKKTIKYMIICYAGNNPGSIGNYIMNNNK